MKALICHTDCNKRKHSVKDKWYAIKEVKNKENRPAVLILGIDEKMIREWRLQKAEPLTIGMPNKRFRLNDGGLHIIREILEARLLSFVEDLRSEKYRVTAKITCRKGERIWRSLCDEDPELKVEFKANIVSFRNSTSTITYSYAVG